MRDSRTVAIGQLLFIELEEDRWNTSGERLLRTWQPGGILLSARTLRTPSSVAQLLHKIVAALTAPPLLALEEEGGVVDPLAALFPPLPSPQAAARGGQATVARMGELIGAGLKLLGFNTNLAPLLDLAGPQSDSSLGTRTFSADATTVAECGAAFVSGMRRHRILTCGKYFPGLGGSVIDRHSKLPTVLKSMSELWRTDLVPYRELLPRLPLVMLSHAAYKAYDFDPPCPATLSSNVAEGLLRIKLGYRGVAVADDLNSEPIRRTLGLEDAAVKSVNAGCDLLLVRGRSEETVETIVSALRSRLDSGRLSRRRLAQALRRIQAAKKRVVVPSGRVSQKSFDRLVREFEEFSKQSPSQA